MSKNGSRDRVSSSSCVLGGIGAVSLSTLSTIRSSDDKALVFRRLRAFCASPRALNRPTTVVVALMGSGMSCPFRFVTCVSEDITRVYLERMLTTNGIKAGEYACCMQDRQESSFLGDFGDFRNLPC